VLVGGIRGLRYARHPRQVPRFRKAALGSAVLHDALCQRRADAVKLAQRLGVGRVQIDQGFVRRGLRRAGRLAGGGLTVRRGPAVSRRRLGRVWLGGSGAHLVLLCWTAGASGEQACAARRRPSCTATIIGRVTRIASRR
jgi:hypothetical protein